MLTWARAAFGSTSSAWSSRVRAPSKSESCMRTTARLTSVAHLPGVLLIEATQDVPRLGQVARGEQRHGALEGRLGTGVEFLEAVAPGISEEAAPRVAAGEQLALGFVHAPDPAVGQAQEPVRQLVVGSQLERGLQGARSLRRGAPPARGRPPARRSRGAPGARGRRCARRRRGPARGDRPPAGTPPVAAAGVRKSPKRSVPSRYAARAASTSPPSMAQIPTCRIHRAWVGSSCAACS